MPFFPSWKCNQFGCLWHPFICFNTVVNEFILHFPPLSIHWVKKWILYSKLFIIIGGGGWALFFSALTVVFHLEATLTFPRCSLGLRAYLLVFCCYLFMGCYLRWVETYFGLEEGGVPFTSLQFTLLLRVLLIINVLVIISHNHTTSLNNEVNVVPFETDTLMPFWFFNIFTCFILCLVQPKWVTELFLWIFEYVYHTRAWFKAFDVYINSVFSSALLIGEKTLRVFIPIFPSLSSNCKKFLYPGIWTYFLWNFLLYSYSIMGLYT